MKKEKILILRISEKEKKELAEEAKKNEMPMSEFIRHMWRLWRVKHADLNR